MVLGLHECLVPASNLLVALVSPSVVFHTHPLLCVFLLRRYHRPTAGAGCVSRRVDKMEKYCCLLLVACVQCPVPCAWPRVTIGWGGSWSPRFSAALQDDFGSHRLTQKVHVLERLRPHGSEPFIEPNPRPHWRMLFRSEGIFCCGTVECWAL
jgi:hypothetical protein